MRRRMWLAAAAAGVVALCAGQAGASVLFSEAWEPTNVGGYSDQVDFRWADPFALGEASTVDTVTWYGSGLQGQDQTGVAFDVDFYANAAGLPGGGVAHFSGTPTLADTGSKNRSQQEVYLFTLDIDPVVLTANTTYFFSIASHGSAADSQFIWEKSSLTNGALSFHGGNGWQPGQEATAFSLIGNVNVSQGPGVPEPGAWALMITGFAGAGAVLRRRRRLAHA